jgi:predicted AlkP superfamily pyrophosphatase or phosphodiesterase
VLNIDFILKDKKMQFYSNQLVRSAFFCLVVNFLITILSANFLTAQNTPDFKISGHRALIIVIDGLRPDYVTDEIMPTLAGIKRDGFNGQNHHAVYPTSTRVNAASIATGTYPGKHGLVNNSLYIREISDERKFDTGNSDDLLFIEKAYAGQLLTTETLGKMLGRQNKKLFISSSGSSGAAYLLASGTGNSTLVHRELIIPDSLSQIVRDLLGPVPADEQHPYRNRMRWSVDALLKIGIDLLRAEVIITWITEPDGSAHSAGIGSPLSLEALRLVDSEIALILNGLEERGLLKSTNMLIISDHGFSTRVGSESLTELLIEKGLKSAKSSTDVIVANDAIYVNERKAELIPLIVRLLQHTEWIGPVFTRGADPLSMQGSVPGTFSFTSIMWDHQRSADILTSGNWTHHSNKYGFKGEVRLPGVAGHNSTSPYDIRASFFAAGPDFKSRTTSPVPSGNTDIVPTVLHLLGVELPDSLDGRIIREMLKEGPAIKEIRVTSEKYIAETTADNIHYQTILYKSSVEGTTYLDSTVTTRF